MLDTLTFPTRDPGQTIVRVGADVGQRQDYSALVVTEEERRLDLPHYLVRSIERLPLGTPYPAVVDRIAEIVERLERRARPRLGPRLFTTELILDATGVGLPIGDMLRERGLDVRLVLFTGSDKLTMQPQGVTMVGKAWLVSRMQVLLQSQRLHLPRTVQAGTLAKELLDYRIDVSDAGHASFNAKSGAHDDLVIALGLSCGVERSAGRVTSSSYVSREPTPQERLQERGRWERQREQARRRQG
jgi:hypothetical protein